MTTLAPRFLCRHPLAKVMVILAVLGSATTARAEPSPEDRALASTLFQEGRRLMLEGRLTEACPKLEESQRLDPGGGTLLNLALCHEQQSRLARSWTEFSEALVIARRDGRRDRELEAETRVRTLEPRLSRLTIVVPPSAQVPGLRIEQDGRYLGPGAWSTAIPVDGGRHVVQATAPGREPFSVTIEFANEGDARTIEIPTLAPVRAAIQAPTPEPTPPRTREPSAPDTQQAKVSWQKQLRWAGIGTAGAGAALLATAGYSLAMALDAKHDAESDCTGDTCDSAGLERRETAVARGNLATWLGVAGFAMLGVGGTLYYLGSHAHVPTREPRAKLRFNVGAGPQALVTSVEGGF